MRAKRLYRVTLSNVSQTVRHFQSRTYALSWARSIARSEPYLDVTVEESESIEWRETPLFTARYVRPELNDSGVTS